MKIIILPQPLTPASLATPANSVVQHNLPANEESDLQDRLMSPPLARLALQGFQVPNRFATTAASYFQVNQSQVPRVSSKLLVPGAHGGVMFKASDGLIQFGAHAGVMDDMFGHYLAKKGFLLPENERRHAMPMRVVVDPVVEPTSGLLPLEFTQYGPFIVFPKFTQERKPEQRMHYVTSDEQTANSLRDYLRISLNGPRDNELPKALDRMVREEYPKNFPSDAIPRMRAELKCFGNIAATDLAAVTHFDADGRIEMGNVTLVKDGFLRYLVWDKGEFLGVIDLGDYPCPPRELHPNFNHANNTDFQRNLDLLLRQERPGVIPISTANGFTGGGGESTSGFMVWNQGRVTLVDPPLHTLEFSIANGIPLSSIDGIVITHGHGDHLTVGFSELIKALPQVQVIASSAVMAMIKLQYSKAVAEGGIHPRDWNTLIVAKQKFTKINGLNWRLNDGFHAVMAFGFEIWDKPDTATGQPIFVYSGDTAIGKEILTGSLDNKTMKPARRRAVMRPLDVLKTHYRKPPYVMIEAGSLVAKDKDPHSPLDLIESEVAKIQDAGFDTSRVRYYHNKTGGIENVAPGKSWKSDASGFIDLGEFFNQGRISTHTSGGKVMTNTSTLVEKLKRVGVAEFFSDGETVIQKNDWSRDVYLVLQGSILVKREGEKRPVSLFEGDVFGEMAYVNKQRRSATVMAQSLTLGNDVEVLRIPAQALDILTREDPKILDYLTSLALERRRNVA